MVLLLEMLTTSYDRFESRLELGHIEWFDQIIVSTRFETFELVGQLVSSGEHNYGRCYVGVVAKTFTNR